MSSLDKLFVNSLKNDITHSFIESVEAIMFLEGISSSDFLKINKVSVYTPEIKNEFSLSSSKLAFTDRYVQEETEYDILGVWLYKLSENLRRLYSAHKKGNDISSLVEQQNNLYTLSNYFLEYWTTDNEPTFFPRAVFGRHEFNLQPLDYLLYLGTHDCLTPENFENHLNLFNKLKHLIDFSSLPEFIPKLALSSKNSKLFKNLLPLIPPSSLLNTLNYYKSSDGFKILSYEYIFEHPENFNLPDYQKIDLMKNFLRDDVLLSRHFDNFILDKTAYIQHLASFMTPEVSKGIEVIFVNKSSKFPIYETFKPFFFNQHKKSNPYSLMHELKSLSFEDIQMSYEITPTLISDTIQSIIESSVLKENQHSDYFYYAFKNLVEKLHPVLEKEHLAHIISLNSDFITFCKPVYLHIRLNEKLSSEKHESTPFLKKNKI